MRPSTPSVQISVVALMTCALTRLTLDLWSPGADDTFRMLIIAITALHTVSLVALVPFALHRLPPFARAGLALWGLGIVGSIYVTVWIVHATTNTNVEWIPNELWFLAEPFGVIIGQSIIALAVVRGLALAEDHRPRNLELAAFGVIGLGAIVLIVNLYLMMHDDPPRDPIMHLGEVAMSTSLFILGGMLALARARLAARDIPAARTVG